MPRRPSPAPREAIYVYVTPSRSPKAAPIERVTLGRAKAARAGRAAGARAAAQAAAAGIELARELGNLPGQPLHADAPGRTRRRSWPRNSASRSRCSGRKEIEKLGMGSFLAVAQGSRGAAALHRRCEYQGGAARARRRWCWSARASPSTPAASRIKPARRDGRDEVRHVRRGQRAGHLPRASAELKPALNVVGLIPTCENMPDGRAVKPGDIVTSMSGQTIEILNTDAEGRLILCDALTYAERFKPRGGDRHRDADRRLRGRAGRRAQRPVRAPTTRWPQRTARPPARRRCDPCWRMPLDDEYARGAEDAISPTWPTSAAAPAARSPRPSSCSASRASTLGAPGHRRHRLEERRGQGLDRPSGRPAARSSCWLARAPGRRGRSRRAASRREAAAHLPRMTERRVPLQRARQAGLRLPVAAQGGGAGRAGGR